LGIFRTSVGGGSDLIGVLREFVDLEPKPDDFRTEILSGLSTTPKTSSAKFFYDDIGSHLFEQICNLDEYYPTRTECEILVEYASKIRTILPVGATVIEFGSGGTRKIKLLSDALPTIKSYVPIDISRGYLLQTATTYARDNPSIEVRAICADFTNVIELDDILDNSPRVGFFPGSTIGNFTYSEALKFLRYAAKTLGPGNFLIIGVDLEKDIEKLISAYDDKLGVTAAFNLNILTRINYELAATFALDLFRHKVLYNNKLSRIEMHLESIREHEVRVDDCYFNFDIGETIHTESSHKYTIDNFIHLANDGGFSVLDVLSDPDKLFSVHILQVS
jgi:L-histidine N-alpha-methyltransferase